MERAVYLWAAQEAEAHAPLSLVALHEDVDKYYDVPGHYMAYFYAEGFTYGYLREEVMTARGRRVIWRKVANPVELEGNPVLQILKNNGEYIFTRERGVQTAKIVDFGVLANIASEPR